MNRIRSPRTALVVAAMLAVALSPAPAGAAAVLCMGRLATIAGNPSDNTLRGTMGNDVIAGLGGNDAVYGLGGNDLLCGGGGRDRLLGGPGSDRLGADKGPDVLDGGTGFDRADYSSRITPVNVTLNGKSNDGGRGEGDLVRSTVEAVLGGRANDHLTGSPMPNTLNGGLGNDAIQGSGGDDTLIGSAGADQILGGGSNDLLVGGPGNDLTDGEGLDDVFAQFGYRTYTSGPSAIVDGGTTYVSLDLPPGEIRDINVRVDIEHPATQQLRIKLLSPSAVQVNLSNGRANGTPLTGTTFDSEAETNIARADGDSSLPLSGRWHPEGSLDRSYRGTEVGGTWVLRIDDTSLDGVTGVLNWWSIEIATPTALGDGSDRIRGSSGVHDLVDYSARTADLTVRLDSLAGDGQAGEMDNADAAIESAYGGSGSDSILGNAWNNDLRGWTGDDSVLGGPGHDTVMGYDGSDTLRGGIGGDLMEGGAGDDAMYGDEGNDSLDGGIDTDSLDGGPAIDTCLNWETAVNCELF